MFPLRCIHPSDCPETPAAGARSRETGALESVGANGDYYSSSSFVTGNNNAGNLWFNATGVNPLNNGTRAWARAVRCVQHLHRSCRSVSLSAKAAWRPEWCGPRFVPARRQIQQSADARPSVGIQEKGSWLRSSRKPRCGNVSCTSQSVPGPERSPGHSIQRLPQAPAAGVRDRTDGALNAVGANGDYYSSSSNASGSINVGYLWFNASNVNPLNGNNRAYARAVRCVQHLPGPLSRTLRPVR